MTINGNIKFLKENKIDDDKSFSFTSASATLKSYLYDNDLNTKLISIGSDDVTPEVWIVTFATPITFDRACVFGHNIKSGNFQYSDDNQGSWNDFSAAISWSANSTTNNYYEFNEVSGVTDIRLTMNTTMVVDAQKEVAQWRVFSEEATIETNPISFDHFYEDRSVTHGTAKGGCVHVSNSGTKDKFRVKMRFDDAGTTDMTTFRTLKNRNDAFYIYPCGGDTTHPGIDQEGFRIQDMYYVNWINVFRPSIREVLGIGTDITMQLWEVG
jgi:hypothetical protein